MKLLTELVQHVESMDAHYDSLYVFLAGCYDKEKGGFYEYIGARGEPKLESTARAMRILDRGDAFDELPDNLKRSLTAYFQRKQDPGTGFFEDLQEKRAAENRRGRALSYATRSLNMLGAEPLYQLPTVKSNRGVEHIQSTEAFVQWMEDLDWNKPWASCAAISSQPTLIKNQPDSIQSAIVSASFEWLAQNQDPETGWWGNDIPYRMLSGAFKLGIFYKAFDRSMPNPDKIYNSIMKTVRKETSHDGCWVRNTLDLLEVIRPGYEGIPVEDKEILIEVLSRNILQLKRRDGGYARNERQQFSVTDGCSQAMKTRDCLRKLVGLEEKPFPNGDLFLRNL